MSSESEYDTVFIIFFFILLNIQPQLTKYNANGRLFYPFVSIDLHLLYPVSIVAIVENNEIRLENNDISGHILPALFSNRLTLVSHYSAFSSVRRTDANVLNCSKHPSPSCERNGNKVSPKSECYEEPLFGILDSTVWLNTKVKVHYICREQISCGTRGPVTRVSCILYIKNEIITF